MQRFVGEYRIPHPLLDADAPTTQGPFAMPDYYFELRRQQVAAIEPQLAVFDELCDELERSPGRRYGLVERYELDDADRAIVCLGSTAGTVKDVVDELRAEGQRVGLLRSARSARSRLGAVRDALRSVLDVAVLDRADSPGGAPPLFAEVGAATRTATRRASGATSTAWAAAICIPTDIRASSIARAAAARRATSD